MIKYNPERRPDESFSAYKKRRAKEQLAIAHALRAKNYVKMMPPSNRRRLSKRGLTKRRIWKTVRGRKMSHHPTRGWTNNRCKAKG